MTREIQRIVLGADSLAYQVACRYADGARVLASSVCELAEGKIFRETVVQAWDA